VRSPWAWAASEHPSAHSIIICFLLKKKRRKSNKVIIIINARRVKVGSAFAPPMEDDAQGACLCVGKQEAGWRARRRCKWWWQRGWRYGRAQQQKRQASLIIVVVGGRSVRVPLPFD
jgi:hypothetical protein